MIFTYTGGGPGLVKSDDPSSCAQAMWIDLLNPTSEEDRFVETSLGIDIPTREEMQEIEASSRLYQERGAHFMTATIVFRVDTPDPQTSEITFILTDKRLVTVRYAEPRAFQLFTSQVDKGDIACDTPAAIMVGLIEAIVEREADLIQRLQSDTDRIAQNIFEMKGGSGSRVKRFDVVLKQVGKLAEIASRVRESLVSITRLLVYLGNLVNQRGESEATRLRVRSEAGDVQSLADHVSYLNSRLTFMLDASLGMVSIEQNQIIKLFSVVAVMLMPPTLVASIYGMNFRLMPELEWPWGYPFALGLMLLAAIVPFFYFKRKGWL